MTRSLSRLRFVELAEKLGIDPTKLGDVPRSDGEPYTSHSQFLFHWPRFKDGTKCVGTMRVEARRDRVWELVCDACGFEVAVPAGTGQDADWLAARACLPPLAEKPFDPTDGTAACRQALREWLAQPREDLLPAPALHGKPGRGKTHLLALLGKQVIAKHGARVLFLGAPAFLSELQSQMGSPRYEETWQRAVEAEVLLLDDLGAEQSTDWRADRIAALVDERYRRAAAIAFTTNVRPEDWEAAFDARTVSRLRGMTFPLELRGPDRRQQTIPTAEGVRV